MPIFGEKNKSTKIKIKGEDKFKQELNPNRDWRVVVVFFAVMLFGVFLSAYFMFVRLMSLEELAEIDSQAEVVRVIDQNAVRQLIEQIETKETRLNEFRSKPPSIVDPSL